MAVSSAVWSASKLVAVTPSDSDNLPAQCRGFMMGTGGTIAAVDTSGGAVLLKNLIAGVVYPIQITRVNLTGTTAADIVALY